MKKIYFYYIYVEFYLFVFYVKFFKIWFFCNVCYFLFFIFVLGLIVGLIFFEEILNNEDFLKIFVRVIVVVKEVIFKLCSVLLVN